MPKRVANNVVDYRVIDNGNVCEDVTSITPPTISHPTTTIDSAGMAMAVDMPNTTHLEAAELTIAHNNGVNCALLATPGKHQIECRLARQNYNVNAGENEFESVKMRAICVFKSKENGNVETGNPLGSTIKYSVLRYEEIFNGETVLLVDAMAGIIEMNGKSFTDPVERLLS